MNTGFLLRTIHRTINSVVPKILSIQSIQNVLPRRIHYICDRERLNHSLNNLSNYNISAFLQPTLPTYNSVCGLKVKGRMQLRCKDCYYIWRHERFYVMCKTHPRHKQTQLMKQTYKTWIITSASQSKVRGW